MTQDLRISARQLQMFIDESPDQIQFKAGTCTENGRDFVLKLLVGYPSRLAIHGPVGQFSVFATWELVGLFFMQVQQA